MDDSASSGRTNILKKIIGFLNPSSHEDDVTEEEIISMVNEGHEQGVLRASEAEMIHNIFEFGEKQAQDVMTHRKSIAAIDSTATVQEAFDFIMNESYSRYPVIDGDIDNIMGILHIRDLLKVYVDEQKRCKQLSEIKDQVLFDAYYIPETRNISLLFKEMQSKKVHIAVVVDEYGQTAGIVTMEDILEEIVGNIFDEYDDEERTYVVLNDHTWIFEAKTQLTDFYKIAKVDEDEFEKVVGDADTLAGMLLEIKGEFPALHEKVTYHHYEFEVLEMDSRRILKVKFTILPKDMEGSVEKE